MTTIDNIMALADDYAEEYSSAMVPQTKQAVIDAKEALRTALTEALAKDVSLINEGNKAQPVRGPSCETCKHCTVASQDSFEETCFICSHYYDSKYEVKT